MHARASASIPDGRPDGNSAGGTVKGLCALREREAEEGEDGFRVAAVEAQAGGDLMLASAA